MNNSIKDKLMGATFCGEFLTFTSFLYTKFGCDTYDERHIWLWVCSILAGLTLFCGGVWIGFCISQRLSNKNEK